MSSQTAVYLRFPSGFSEIKYPEDPPKVGDTLRRGHDTWHVVAVETDANGCAVVTLGQPDALGQVSYPC